MYLTIIYVFCTCIRCWAVFCGVTETGPGVQELTLGQECKIHLQISITKHCDPVYSGHCNQGIKAITGGGTSDL